MSHNIRPNNFYTTYTGCSFNIVFFLKCFFLNSASFAATLVFDLPLCTHSDTERKPREARVRNIFKNLKKTIFNEHPVALTAPIHIGFIRRLKVLLPHLLHS